MNSPWTMRLLGSLVAVVWAAMLVFFLWPIARHAGVAPQSTPAVLQPGASGAPSDDEMNRHRGRIREGGLGESEPVQRHMHPIDWTARHISGIESSLDVAALLNDEA